MRAIKTLLIITAVAVAITVLTQARAQVFPSTRISPDPLEFADTRVGQTAAVQTVTITNLGGTLPLVIFSVKLANSVNFQITNNLCNQIVLDSGESCTVDVTFTPDKNGHFITSLSVIEIGREIVKTSIVEGNGVEPIVTLSTNAINFGEQTVGKQSSAHEILMTNSGSTNLSITNIGVSGEFNQTDDCGDTLAPQASCTINAKFAPVSIGDKTGEITIIDDASGSPHTIAMSGKGIAPGQPDADLSKHSIDFGYVPVGTTVGPQTITLTSTGTVNLNVNAITASANFASTNNCPATLAPDASCTISVTFTPPSIGAFSGTLTVDDNAADSPQTAALSGNGIQSGGPMADLSANSLDFGELPIDTPGNPQEVTVTNTGTEDLVIQDVDLEGDSTHSYSAHNTCKEQTLPAGSSCKITITFTPATEGTLSAIISIKDNAADSPQIIVVTGEGAKAGGGGGCSLILK